MDLQNISSVIIENFEKELYKNFGISESNSNTISALATECAKAHQYPLRNGGKRIRPKIVIYLANAFGGEGANTFSFPFAAALEMVHTYSLVHDDLPCMDNDSLRRGKPTTHVVYGDAKALLVGDGLLTTAFEVLGKMSSGLDGRDAHSLRKSHIISEAVFSLATAAGTSGMLLGQWFDISITKSIIGEAEKLQIVEQVALKKTGALFGAAFELGVLAAHGANSMRTEELNSPLIKEHLQIAKNIGNNIGLLFQLTDDILDETSTAEMLGKTVGKDFEQGKLTFVSALGIDKAKEYAAKCLGEAKNGLALIAKTMPQHEKTSLYLELTNELLTSLLGRSK